MAKTSIVYVSSSGRASLLEIDAIVARESAGTVELTKFPIENGSAISDHAIRHPDTFRISGVVSDMPATEDASKVATDADGNVDPEVSRKYDGTSSRARDTLERILADKRTVTIESGGRTYEDRVMVSLRFPEVGGGEATRSAVRFDAEFEKVVTVATETVAMPASKAATVNDGKKPTEKASKPVEEKASAFYKTSHYLRGK